MSKKFQADLEVLAAKLDAARSEQGAYKTVELEDIVAALMSIAPDEGIRGDEWRELCRHAAYEVGNEPNPTTGESLKKAVRKQQREFLKRDSAPFVVATSVVISPHLTLPNARIDGKTVTFSPTLPRQFDRQNVHDYRGGEVVKDDARYYQARVRVCARTQQGAYSEAMDVLDFMRGAWNLSLNRDLVRQSFWREDAPINKVLPGPLHTLHNPNGSSAWKAFWYERFFDAPSSLPNPSRKWPRVTREWKTIRAMTKRSGYGSELKEGLTRYCRALDNRDPELAFLRLWGLLEFLTHTGRKSYDETIKRALFIYADPTLERPVIEGLRRDRNRSVHSGVDEIRRNSVLRLHRFVADLFVFLFNMSWFFGSLEEAGEFLSLPPERALLKRRYRLHREAIRFSNY